MENNEELKKQVSTLNLRIKELEKHLEGSPPLLEDYFQYPFINPSAEYWKSFQLIPWDIKDFDSNWTVVPDFKDRKRTSKINRMQDEMNRMFQDSFHRRGWPNSGILDNSIFYDENFDLEKTEEGYMLKLNIKGLDKENINIDTNENSITISGKYSQQVAETNSYGLYSLKGYGSFLKTMPLPGDADTDKMETIKEADSLIIKIPKK